MRAEALLASGCRGDLVADRYLPILHRRTRLDSNSIFLSVSQSSRDGTISKKENQMKSKIAYSALAAAALLALTQLAAAQGTSGSTGAIASIPGTVVRGHEQGHGLMSIITGSTLPQPNVSKETMTRRGQNPTPPK
jgi:hypothetical protein